jgi:hypothetical protein
MSTTIDDDVKNSKLLYTLVYLYTINSYTLTLLIQLPNNIATQYQE